MPSNLTATAVIRLSVAAFLGILVGLFVAYMLFRPRVSSFASLAADKTGPVELKDAEASLEAYRKSNALTSLDGHARGKIDGIIHDSEAFMKHYKDVFVRFTESHTNLVNYPTCKWRLGLYPNIVFIPGTTKPRLNLYFIPTLQDTVSGKVHDYFDFITDPNSPYLKKDLSDTAWRDGESYIFDQGTLFP